MRSTELLPWPRFALRSVTCPEGVPDSIRQVLEQRGVPERSVGGEYLALESAVFLERPEGLLAFGKSGLDGRICVDVYSLEVVHVPTPGGCTINSVNSNLILFSSCVEAVFSRFPFYSYETVEELGERVAESLREELSRIDSSVGEHNGFWETFLDDVAIGDYADEEYERAG